MSGLARPVFAAGVLGEVNGGNKAKGGKKASRKEEGEDSMAPSTPSAKESKSSGDGLKTPDSRRGMASASSTPRSTGSARSSRPGSARKTPSPFNSVWGKPPSTPGSGERPFSARSSPTVPKPFRMSTDGRARTSPSQEDFSYKPEIHGVKTKTLREYKAPPKPSPKESTTPEPFQLMGQSKYEAATMKIALMAAQKEAEETAMLAQASFRSSPVPDYGPTFQPTKSPQELTKPEAPKFVVEERLQKRHEFDNAVAERLWIKEMEKAEENARKKAEEDAEVAEMRKSLYVPAHVVPDWYYDEKGPLELRKVPTPNGRPSFKV